jgi:hypothetical protein
VPPADTTPAPRFGAAARALDELRRLGVEVTYRRLPPARREMMQCAR